jgi:hypothetical protein
MTAEKQKNCTDTTTMEVRRQQAKRRVALRGEMKKIQQI